MINFYFFVLLAIIVTLLPVGIGVVDFSRCTR